MMIYNYIFHCSVENIWIETSSTTPPTSYTPVCPNNSGHGITSDSLSLINLESDIQLAVNNGATILGIPSYYYNGTPYWRSSTTVGTYTLGYFYFPGTSSVGLPSNFRAIGNVEATSSSSYFIQIYDVTNSLLISQIDFKANSSLTTLSTSTLNNLPANAATFALRGTVGATTTRLRVAGGYLEW